MQNGWERFFLSWSYCRNFYFRHVGREKQKAYSCDITYATNNELGFDYLRDNMAFSSDQKMLQELSFAIIDEVDSILIDEARTPLVISGPSGDHGQSLQSHQCNDPKVYSSN